jgi:amino acid adenylation domain-containing protein
MNPQNADVDPLPSLAGRLESPVVAAETPGAEAAAAGLDAESETTPVLNEAERRRVLVEWNATTAPIPDFRVDELFVAQAVKTPDAVAIEDGERQLSYRDLDNWSNRLARSLCAQGVSAETLVGIFLERSIEAVVAVLGIWKAGGAYVPLDPRLPKQRLLFVIEDTAVRVIVTDPQMPKDLCGESDQLVFLDVDVDVDRNADDGPLAAQQDETREDRLAYLLHTSGSTGTPKGVAITHRNTVNLLCGEQRLTGFGPTDVMLALTTLTFDISVLELMLPLTTGGSIRVVSPDVVVDGRQLQAVIEESHVTYVQSTPSIWRMLVQTGFNGSPRITAISGGEPLPRDLADSLLDRVGVLWNMYGPTETTVYSTAGRVSRGTAMNVGRPLANTQAYILNRDLEPVPIDEEGDLYLGGEGVARGYWNRPALTDERFRRNRFSTDPSARLYFTGDRARFCPNGDIELVGRSDRQIKLRGLRIELGEIECILVQHPAVANAAVVARPDASGDLRLVCFFATRADAAVDVASLRDYLKARLPDYMVPAAFQELPALPLTPGGKIDRKSLPELEPATAPRDRRYSAPRDAVETGLAAIWSRVLQLDRVGLDDHFFDLGGHSIQAVRMLAEAERQFGHAPALRSIFKGPTLAEVAAAIRERQTDQAQLVMRDLLAGTSESIDQTLPPLIVAPSLFGVTGDWRQVFAQTSGHRPVYGIDSEGNEPYLSESPTLEEIAARCITAIPENVRSTAYHLAGFSFGAWLVYEMARQLGRAGNPPRSVTVIDSSWTGTPRSWAERLFRDLPSILANAPRWLAANVDQASLRRIGRRYRRSTGRLVSQVGSQKSPLTPILSGAHSLFDIDRLPDVYRRRLVLSMRAQAGYHPGPRPYSGRVAYLECRVRPFIHRNTPDGGWSALVTGPLEVHRIPRSHHTAMDGTNLTLRTIVLDVLQRADAESTADRDR